MHCTRQRPGWRASWHRCTSPTRTRSAPTTLWRLTGSPADSPPSASTCSQPRPPPRRQGHHQAAGRRTAATAATIKADTLATQCEGARTPALDARQSHDLTPRELEIATMAARGLSSKADRRTAGRFCAHRRQHPAPGICQARGKQQGRPPPPAGTRARRHPGIVQVTIGEEPRPLTKHHRLLHALPPEQ